MVLTNTVGQNNSLYKKIAIFFVFAFFFWCFSVAIHDILYPVNNLEFVRFLLKGDGTSPSLSITNESAVTTIFYVAVVFESLIALILFIAAILMVLDFCYNKFAYANSWAMVGFAMVLFKYFVFFVIVFAEWFYMWKTSEPSQIKAILFSIFTLLGLIFLSLDKKNQ